MSAAPTIPSAPSYPREFVQHLLDQAAFFNLLAAPDPKRSDVAIRTGGSIVGVKLRNSLHRLQVITSPPARGRPVTCTNAAGQSIGHFNQRWMFVPENFVGLPDLEPPSTPFDHSRSQRFVMLNGDCSFGDGETGFRGFGAGFTIPGGNRSRNEIEAVAVGTLVSESGELAGFTTGMYIFNGVIRPEHGFTGNFLLRIMDPQGTLSSDAHLPPLEQIENPDPDVTYFIIRGVATESQVVQPLTGPGGSFKGLQISQDLRLCSIDSSFDRRRGLRSEMGVGQVTGIIHTTVVVSPTDPRGTTPLTPIPGHVFGEYVFFDAAGNNVAGFKVDFTESRSFRVPIPAAPGIQTLLAGNIGRIYGGTGAFAGLDGLASDNLLVSFFPHVSSGIYVLRVNAPQNKLRAVVSDD
jgi:hypothetical protein